MRATRFPTRMVKRRNEGAARSPCATGGGTTRGAAKLKLCTTLGASSRGGGDFVAVRGGDLRADEAGGVEGLYSPSDSSSETSESSPKSRRGGRSGVAPVFCALLALRVAIASFRIHP